MFFYLFFWWLFNFVPTANLKGHRQPQVFAGVQAIGAIFCNTENGADNLHADIATAPTSYRRDIQKTFFHRLVSLSHVFLKRTGRFDCLDNNNNKKNGKDTGCRWPFKVI